MINIQHSVMQSAVRRNLLLVIREHQGSKLKPATTSPTPSPPPPPPTPHPQPSTSASPPRASRRTLPVRARGRVRRGLRSPLLEGLVVVGTGIETEMRTGTGAGIVRPGTGTGRPGHGDGPKRSLGSRLRLRRGWRPSGWVGVLMLMLRRMGIERERGVWMGLVKGLVSSCR